MNSWKENSENLLICVLRRSKVYVDIGSNQSEAVKKEPPKTFAVNDSSFSQIKSGQQTWLSLKRNGLEM